MPFSEELGMRVYDPQEGARMGLAQAQLFAQGMSQGLQARELKMRENEVAAKAKQQLHRQIGLDAFQKDAATIAASEESRLRESGMDPAQAAATAKEHAMKTSFFKWSPLILEGVEQGGAIVERLIAAEERAQQKRDSDSRMYELRKQIADQATEREAGRREMDLMKLTQAKELATAKLEAQQAKVPAFQQEAEYLGGLQAQERSLLGKLNQPEDEYPGQHQQLQEQLAGVQDKIAFEQSKHPVMEETITLRPGGETTVERKRATTGKQATLGALTTTEQTRLGEDIQASSNALRVLNDLQGQLDSGAVGLVPTINSIVFDRVLGQFDPALVNEHRVTARQNIGIATQQVLGELNNRGRFSNMELQAIKNLMPSLGAVEAPQRARMAVQGLRKVLAEKGASAAVKMKREIPPELINALSEMTDVELVNEVKNGAMDAATMWQIYNAKHSGVK